MPGNPTSPNRTRIVVSTLTVWIPIAMSLAPYLIVFDDAGRPLGSSAQLDGKVPVPPEGMFTYAKQNGENRVTWQPAPGVRSAAVLARFEGQRSGYVLAGRSLREVETRESQLSRMVILAWGLALGASLVTAALLAVFSARQASTG